VTDIPVLLLDVDGVLNASRAGWSAPPRSGWATSNDVWYRMRWEPRLMVRLRLLLDAGSLEIRWATSWVGDTDRLEVLFDLPHLPSAWDPATPVPNIDAAKRGAATTLAAAGRRVIWVDDEAFVGWDGRAGLEDAGHLLIAPRSGRGLRPEDMDRIEEFCRVQPARVRPSLSRR
jgi:hypothetical protein